MLLSSDMELIQLVTFDSSQDEWFAQRGEEAGEAGSDALGLVASSSGKVRRRKSLPRPPSHTGDWSPLALPLVM